LTTRKDKSKIKKDMMKELSAPNSKSAPSNTNDKLPMTINMLFGADIFRGMEPSQLGLFFENTRVENYPFGTTLFTPDESSERLFILRRGRVAIYRLTKNGRRLVTRQILPGSVFGVMGLVGQTMQGSFAEATEDSEICTITRDDVLVLLKKRPDIALRTLEIVGNRLRLLEERLIEAVYSPIKVRLAHFLLSNADPSSGLLTNFTHEEIGDNIGAVRQSVTETLGIMQKQGLISISPKQIQIIDRCGLEKLIQTCQT
jgi:CRP/FNR family transcriptional regulator, cyclic AMP receptor protein